MLLIKRNKMLACFCIDFLEGHKKLSNSFAFSEALVASERELRG